MRLLASRVLTPAGWLEPGAVSVTGDRITGVAPWRGAAPERVLAPGFVDLQVNGHVAVDVATAAGPTPWSEMDRLLVRQGVTTWFPTLVSGPLAGYGSHLDRLAQWAAWSLGQPGRAQIGGVHLEGPFLGAVAGAHQREHIRPPDLAFCANLPALVKLMTLGPEQPGAAAAIAALVERGVVVALGHTAASAEQMRAAASAGATLVTHLFNAMPSFHHRAPGPVGVALTDPRLAVSLIADGHHLHPDALATAMAAKGPGGWVLVTDAAAWAAGDLGGQPVSLVDGAPRLADGTLAGSALTMDRAVAVAMGAGASLEAAVEAASTTPARLMGLADRGAIAPGLRADLVALGADGVVQLSVAGGVPIEP